MITVASAQAKLVGSAVCRKESQSIKVSSALGRVASKDVVSPLAIPPCDNSAMDGFAVNSGDVLAEGLRMRISQRVPAGQQPNSLELGTAARIFTGAGIPAGADSVVIQENAEYDDEFVTLGTKPRAKDNIRPKGQDISVGAVVVKAGKKLTAIDLSLLASIGCVNVAVYKRLKVAVFSTGNELVEPGRALSAGQIYNSNRALLSGLCQQLSFEIVDCGIVDDTLEATKLALSEAASRADLIISSGGVSVGDEDHVKPAVESLGSLSMWKVQMKPGKPVVFGEVAGVPFLGLPGNPVSSFVVFQLLGLPLACALQGQNYQLPTAFNVLSGFDKKRTKREEYVRVRLSRDKSGSLMAEQFANLSSGVMSSLSWADGLVRQAIDTSITCGDSVEFLPLNEGLL